jgi:hypothetical protein
MNQNLRIDGIGVCAPGFADWDRAHPVLAGTAPFVPSDVPKPVAGMLPATERRRANTTTRWALHAASQAVSGLSAEGVAALPSVFASSDGDGEVLATVLRDLAGTSVRVSPTTFHNSVYNAPGGYWSIASRSPAASTTICVGAASFAAALLEAAAQVAETQGAVLLVACDHPFPDDSPIRTPVRSAFACALRLAPAHDSTAARIEQMAIRQGAARAAEPLDAFYANAAAAALPLLRAVARAEPASLALPYLDDSHLALRFSP